MDLLFIRAIEVRNRFLIPVMCSFLHTGEGLLVANDARWARFRRLLTPAFHFDILKPYVQVFTETGNDLVVSHYR